MRVEKSFSAFTLAEVLITLGIIGVVAAMTMPTLINQTNGAQYKAAYKKALSAISQGVTLNVALEDISFADIANGTAGKTDEKNTIANILSQRMNVVKTDSVAFTGFPTDDVKYDYKYTCTADDAASETVTDCSSAGEITRHGDITLDTYLYFNDSSMFAFKNAVGTNVKCTSATPCYGAIDVNGAKGPNKQTVDGDNPSDIYPVRFYDQTILPNSKAAAKVLYGK